MSTEHTVWKGKVDLALQDLNKLVAELKAQLTTISGEHSMLKIQVDGFDMAMTGMAGVNTNVLNELSEIRDRTSASIGLDGICTELKKIEHAIRASASAPAEASPFTLKPTQGRDILAPESHAPPSQPPRKTSDERSPPFEADIDVADVDWRVKGNKDARDTDPFAYAFVYTNKEQHTVRDSVAELVELCNQYGTIKTNDGFLVKLGGTGNSLLNRNIPK